MPEKYRVLVVDDETEACGLLHLFLGKEGYAADTAGNGYEALEKMADGAFDAVVMDIRMPGIDGVETLKRIREGNRESVVIMLTAVDDINVALECIRLGADEFLRKPVVLFELRHSLESALEKRRLQRENREYSRSLEIKVDERTVEIEMTRDATVFALTTLAEYRDPETGGHIDRIREYTKVLAEQLQKSEKYGGIVDDKYVTNIYKGSPLHDIGKVGIPDNILQKPGSLSGEELVIMKTHSVIGGKTLYKAEERLLTISDRSFLTMAKEIAFCHHEKWDGSGYPGGIRGEEIPLAARIMALADVYDALISKRCYKRAFSHGEARGIIFNSSGTHFDPAIVDAFKSAESQFILTKDRFKDAP